MPATSSMQVPLPDQMPTLDKELGVSITLDLHAMAERLESSAAPTDLRGGTITVTTLGMLG